MANSPNKESTGSRTASSLKVINDKPGNATAKTKAAQSAAGNSDTEARPTLKTIAYMTNLAVTTVSRALKDAPDISAPTKARVRLVADQIGYRPNRAGIRLRTGRTQVISLVISLEEEVMGITSQMVLGISDVLSDTPYHLIVTPYSQQQGPLEAIRYICETRSADGVIFSSTEPDDERVRYATAHGMPFATHGRTDMGIQHPYHDFDNTKFTLEAVSRLAAKQRRNLLLLSPPASLNYYRHCIAGFNQGLREHGINGHISSTLDTSAKLDEIEAMIKDLLSGPDRPDGIICTSGSSAIGVIAGIEQAGLTVGKEVDIVSKQSISLLSKIRKEVGTINEDVRNAGRQLATAVLRSIDGEAPENLQSVEYPDMPSPDFPSPDLQSPDLPLHDPQSKDQTSDTLKKRKAERPDNTG